MKPRHLLTILFAVLAVLIVLIGTGLGDEEMTPNTNPGNSAEAPVYDLNWYSVNNGGATATMSASYELGLSAGQEAAGKTNSASFNLAIGFWQSSAVEQPCDCGVWGDVNDDAAINPVDVVYMVNFVYKNQDARVQPPDCPYEAGDVDCNDQVNPVDVVYYVNYVYKNQKAFCDPCT
jgi:hypothetical protein